MRWITGAVLSLLFLVGTGNVYPQSANGELTRREGMLPTIFLKACDKLTTASVDFDGSGDPYRVEWWRCGSKNPNWDVGEFPLHYILVRPSKNKPQALALTLSNSGSSDEYFIDQLHLIRFPVGSRDLLLITGQYYEAGHGTIRCVLERVDDSFQCSTEPRYYTQQKLQVHEKSVLRKVGEYFQGR